jgi:hypothetical protein
MYLNQGLKTIPNNKYQAIRPMDTIMVSSVGNMKINYVQDLIWQDIQADSAHRTINYELIIGRH